MGWLQSVVPPSFRSGTQRKPSVEDVVQFEQRHPCRLEWSRILLLGLEVWTTSWTTCIHVLKTGETQARSYF
jgi:hypothetical protein